MQNIWHSLPIGSVFGRTNSDKDGLSDDEARIRLEKFGPNSLPQDKKYSKLRILLDQFNNPLMIILLVAVLISFFLRHYPDSIFILVVVFINAIVGFYQENKANKSIASLKKMVRIRAKVIRGGNEKEIDSEEVVVGDIIILKAGDKVPADGRIIKSKELGINESSLTGEWWAVKKDANTEIRAEAPFMEHLNMVFMGTIVESGWAKFLVTGTGKDTKIGEVVSLLKESRERKTPLQKKIASLSSFLGIIILAVSLIIFTLGILRGKPLGEIFLASLALAVSAIPEGLLPAITVILILGMRRILKKKGLVRKLIANETLGSVTVICTDKTSTLTEGKMQVSHVLTSTRELMNGDNGHIEGMKYSNGAESHIQALKIATIVNEAFIENPEDDLHNWKIRGRSTDKALLMAGVQAGLDKAELERKHPILDRLEFNSEIKCAATLHEENNNKKTLYVIGAPEKIISSSVKIDCDGKEKKLTAEEISKLGVKLEKLTSKGLRVLACARKNYRGMPKYDHMIHLVDDLVLVGFIAIKDPLRKDAKNAIETTKKAGIRTIIITGDHKLTAKAIAEEVGIESKEHNILEGKDLEKISDEELVQKSKYISIYARVSPRHKLRIVEALQDTGEVVAMVGDGVNDAPALKSSDIGIAVGSGTDVAKEVSDLILIDNNFKTIVGAVEQGRIIFQNIRKVVMYLIATDFEEVFIFLASILMGLPIPLLPAQLLWINLIEDGLPDIALTTEQEAEDVMKEKPRNPKEAIISGKLKKWMIAIFFATAVPNFLIFLFLWKLTGDIEKTRTIIFALISLGSLIFVFNVRSLKRPIIRKNIFSNIYINGAFLISLAFLLAAIYVPPLQKILSTQAIDLRTWGIILTISAIEVTVIEISKKIIFTEKLDISSID